AEWRGKVAVAQNDSDFMPLGGGVIATYGTAAAKRWMTGIAHNGYFDADDEAVVATVNNGATPIGIINSYYWYRFRDELGPSGMHSKLYFFPNRDIGSLENISRAALPAPPPNQTQPHTFVA